MSQMPSTPLLGSNVATMSVTKHTAHFCSHETALTISEGKQVFDLTGGPYLLTTDKFDGSDKGPLKKSKDRLRRANEIATDVIAALNEQDVVVHCSLGIERTGLVAACMMMQLGKTASQALDWLDDTLSKRSDIHKKSQSREFVKPYLDNV